MELTPAPPSTFTTVIAEVTVPISTPLAYTVAAALFPTPPCTVTVVVPTGLRTRNPNTGELTSSLAPDLAPANKSDAT